MSAITYLGVLRAIEGLYEAVVTEPAAWGEQALADWANEALTDAGELPKDAVKQIRRSLRAAEKLQSFWTDGRSAVADHDDWRTRVDIALGARAWRPLLDLARIGLEHSPDPELYQEVKERFAVVTSDRWMDGVSFEQWQASTRPPSTEPR
jgi:hypothetical protein